MILTIMAMNTVPAAILAFALDAPEGRVLSPKEFLHMGNRTAVDQALSRLYRDGHLIRVGRGAYVAPLRGRGGSRAPSANKVVESLAALSGELIARDGAWSAVELGLAARGEVVQGYVTSGRSRTLLLGEVEVVLKHAPAWMLMLGNGLPGAAIRAIAWLGPEAAESSLRRVRGLLSSSDWSALLACRAALPSWLAHAIGEFNEQRSIERPAQRGVNTAAGSGNGRAAASKAMPLVNVLSKQIQGTARMKPVQEDRQ